MAQASNFKQLDPLVFEPAFFKVASWEIALKVLVFSNVLYAKRLKWSGFGKGRSSKKIRNCVFKSVL